MKFSNIRTITVPDTDLIFDAQFCPTKSPILTIASVDGHIKGVDLNATSEDDQICFSLNSHHKGNPIRRISYTPDNLLVTASKTIKIYDTEAKKRVHRLIAGDSKIYSLIVVDNWLIACGDDSGTFRLYDYRVGSHEARMTIKECDDCISDLDAGFGNKIVVASSGEGTLTAFNIKSRKLDKPQSELFDSGFTCVRVVNTKNKVLVGADDGVINIFNWREWGNISDRFPFAKKDSVESIELLDASHIIVGQGDGKTKLASIFPNQVISTVFTQENPVECVRVDLENEIIASCAGEEIKVASFSPGEDSDMENASGEGDDSDDSSEDERPKKKQRKTKKASRKEINTFFDDL